MACSEIEYQGAEGTVHSDLCDYDLHHLSSRGPEALAPEYIKFLHDNLDEWLFKSKGTGFFYVGDSHALSQNFTLNPDED